MTKYIYMKILGLVLVIFGFSYCLTSFTKFYAYLFGDIEIANSNIYLMASGLVFPLFMFIFGVFFYFYTDKQFAYINPFIFTSGTIMAVSGIVRLFFNYGIMEFLHLSFGFVSIMMGVFIVVGCVRFKY